jgi:AraC-like DNA-binding protein
MQAEFGIKRESNNSLFYKEWNNDSGNFHFHSQIELYFVTDGEMEITVGDSRSTITAGEMSVALSFTPHGYKTPRFSSSCALIIPTYLCEEFIQATKGKKFGDTFIRDKEVVKLIREYTYKLINNCSNEIERQGYIYLILGTILRHVTLEPSDSPNDASLSSKLLFYINENYKSPITPATISAHFGYTQSYLSRFFKSHFNVTLTKYITLIRLKNTIVLMNENKHSVTYCAFESGFSSMRTFYHSFYEEFGCAPKKYMSLYK